MLHDQGYVPMLNDFSYL